MSEECIICKAPLEYLESSIPMTCEICHQTVQSRARCVQGHFVCDQCHTRGMDAIFSVCLQDGSDRPVEILEKMMSLPFCYMHGPEHHVMVGAALLTACHHAGGMFDLHDALSEISRRGQQVPGGACGYWGACGAGISTGMYISIVTKATPLAEEPWGLANQMTASALAAIGKHGGPRCCKRNAYLAILEACRFTEEKLGIRMDAGTIRCSRSSLNRQCLQADCPFYQGK